MSTFVRCLNLIKTRRTYAWLTPSQQVVLAAIAKVLQVPATVNLFGPAGVGKTFLAWVLAEQMSYVYLSTPNQLGQADSSETKGVIVDNCHPHRQAHRNLLKELHFLQIPCAILLTRELIHDYTHYVELKLTIEDIVHVQQNLASADVIVTNTDKPDLWHLINPHL